MKKKINGLAWLQYWLGYDDIWDNHKYLNKNKDLKCKKWWEQYGTKNSKKRNNCNSMSNM